MVQQGTQKLLRIGELSRRTGVSTSAINYYIREGLLPQPLKTAPNMAYYDPGYVDMINSIKVLQREKGLSLSGIKDLLDRGEFQWTEGFPPEDFTGAIGTGAGTRRALDRRKHIMNVAAGIFSEKGYYATTISDLATTAGIAKGTIYWYFNDKRAIMIAILEDIFSEIVETFGSIMRDAPNGLEAILECVEPALELLERHGQIYLMYFLEIGSADRTIQKKFREIYEVVHEGTRRALVNGMAQGVVREVNPDVAAYAIMGLVERVSQVGTPKPEQLTVRAKAEEAVKLVSRALEADGPEVKKAGPAGTRKASKAALKSAARPGGRR